MSEQSSRSPWRTGASEANARRRAAYDQLRRQRLLDVLIPAETAAEIVKRRIAEAKSVGVSEAQQRREG